MGRENDLVDAFVYLADTLVTGYDVTDFLHGLCERAADVLDASAAGVLLTDERGRLRLVAASTHEMRTLEVFELQSAEGPCADAYRQGDQLMVEDFRREERWPTFTPRALAAGFLAALAVPVRLRNERLGALNVFADRPAGLDAENLRIAQGLADVAAIGILQERALSDAQGRVAHLQRALNSRVLIEQAKGVLTERWGVSPDEAFARLRRHARRNGLRLQHVCLDVVGGAALPDPSEERSRDRAL